VADAEKSQMIVKNHEESMLKIIVELILKVSAGYEKNEKLLAEAVIKDIETLGKIRDNTFINYLLLPLIRNEATRPITLFEKEKFIRQSDESLQWMPNFDVLNSENRQTKEGVKQE
jgi:hypothetical protein